jgi:hypothetical protein
MKTYNVSYSNGLGNMEYSDSIGTFQESARRTYIGYRKTPESREVVDESVSVALFEIISSDVLSVQDIMSFMKFIGMITEDALQVAEAFSYAIGESHKENTQDLLSVLEAFSYDHIEGLNRNTSDLMLARELFEYAHHEPGAITTQNIMLARELFAYDLISTNNLSSQDELNVSDRIIFSVRRPTAFNRQELLIANETFNYIFGQASFESVSDLLSVSEAFSYVLGITTFDSTEDLLEVSESFSYEYIINITQPQNFTVVANSAQCRMEMSWGHPTSGQPDQYRIYRGGVLIDTLSGSTTSYFYNEMQQGVNVTYSITAIVGGQEGPSASDSANLIC